jgi:DNA-binding MarR family transcriptional regulator
MSNMMQLHKKQGRFAQVQEVEKNPSQEPSDAASDAWVRLARAERALVGRIEAELKGAGFPTLSWYDVLLELKRTSEGRLTPREIEEKVLFEQYNLSRLLDRMEADGLVRRIPYPGDRRRQLVEITDRGRALQRSMWGIYGPAIHRHIGAKLTEKEAGQLAALLLRLTQA